MKRWGFVNACGSIGIRCQLSFQHGNEVSVPIPRGMVLWAYEPSFLPLLSYLFFLIALSLSTKGTVEGGTLYS